MGDARWMRAGFAVGVSYHADRAWHPLTRDTRGIPSLSARRVQRTQGHLQQRSVTDVRAAESPWRTACFDPSS